MALPFGKMPTTSVQRGNPPSRRSIGFMLSSLVRCAPGKDMSAGTSCSASSMSVASFDILGRVCATTLRHWVLAASAVPRAKAVAMKAETTRRPLFPA